MHTNWGQPKKASPTSATEGGGAASGHQGKELAHSVSRDGFRTGWLVTRSCNCCPVPCYVPGPCQTCASRVGGGAPTGVRPRACNAILPVAPTPLPMPAASHAVIPILPAAMNCASSALGGPRRFCTRAGAKDPCNLEPKRGGVQLEGSGAALRAQGGGGGGHKDAICRCSGGMRDEALERKWGLEGGCKSGYWRLEKRLRDSFRREQTKRTEGLGRGEGHPKEEG